MDAEDGDGGPSFSPASTTEVAVKAAPWWRRRPLLSGCGTGRKAVRAASVAAAVLIAAVVLSYYARGDYDEMPSSLFTTTTATGVNLTQTKGVITCKQRGYPLER
uniref:Uncharacterized protein n=1 Tax=Oryza barthii TaxID=65489 RepID=A0A0D3F3K3_9ORYZ